MKTRDPRPSAKRLDRVARERFGVTAYRTGQREILDAVFERRDVLGILPTGGGKSLCYQLPALFFSEPTVVVSPLISLMKDQQDHLLRAHVDVVRMDSTVPARELATSEAEIRHGDCPLIYVTPERLETEECQAMLRARGVRLLVVDEAHCIAQWGHDFRPAYLGIGAAARAIGRPPILALTATANEDVRAEIVEHLGLANPHVVTASIERKLQLTVVRTVNEEAKRTHLLEILAKEKGIGIVYVATIATCDEVWEFLREAGIEAGRYHGKMSGCDREETQDRFMGDELAVIVATKAFGMGIDKPDVRFVVHYEFPDSLESYYQEVGRAGRDGKPAKGIILYRLEDRRIQTYFLAGKHPKRETVERALRAIGIIADADREARRGKPTLTVESAALGCELSEHRLECILAELRQAGLVTRDGETFQTTESFDDLVARERVLAGFVTRRQRDTARLATMMRFAQSTECRMRFLLRYFGEERSGPCDACDNCREPPRAVVRPKRAFQEAANASKARSGLPNEPPTPSKGSSGQESRRAVIFATGTRHEIDDQDLQRGDQDRKKPCRTG